MKVISQKSFSIINNAVETSDIATSANINGIKTLDLFQETEEQQACVEGGGGEGTKMLFGQSICLRQVGQFSGNLLDEELFSDTLSCKNQFHNRGTFVEIVVCVTGGATMLSHMPSKITI